MKYTLVVPPLKRIENRGNAPLQPGRLECGVWRLPGCASLRFLRFGLNMPGDPVYFGERHLGAPVLESSSLLLLKRDGDPEILLFANQSFACSEGVFELRDAPDQNGFEVAAFVNCDSLLLAPGESLLCDSITVRSGTDINRLLAEWAESIAQRYGRRIPCTIPTGWNDWQFYRNDKTQQDILDNCAALKKLKERGWPLDFLQIDGGYCLHLSEWSEPKPEFSMGIPAISAYIHDAGFRFGLWFAPYIQNVNTRVAAEHPEWLLRDAAGKIVELGTSNVGKSVLIDYTVPGTGEWLAEQIRMFVCDWHVEWIKLDGPNYALYRRGVLHNRKKTIHMMMRHTHEIIYENARGALVEGEGSMSAAVGLVDLHRVQADNHMTWFIGNDPAQPYAPRVYGKELIMSFLHRIWWCNHRENIILRDYPSPHAFARLSSPDVCEPLFTANERSVQLASAAVAPGGLLLTDPMPELIRRPELLKLARPLFPVSDGRTEILDPFPEDGSAYPHYYRLKNHREELLAIFNWGEETRDFPLPEEYSCRTAKLRFRQCMLKDSCITLGARSAEVLEFS